MYYSSIYIGGWNEYNLQILSIYYTITYVYRNILALNITFIAFESHIQSANLNCHTCKIISVFMHVQDTAQGQFLCGFYHV